MRITAIFAFLSGYIVSQFNIFGKIFGNMPDAFLIMAYLLTSIAFIALLVKHAVRTHQQLSEQDTNL